MSKRAPEWRQKAPVTRPLARAAPKAPEPPKAVEPPKAPEELEVSEPTPPAPWSALWREHGLAVLAVFHGALAARWLVLSQVWSSPYQRVQNIDSVGFEVFARRVWDGASWLPDRAFYQSPFYGWVLAAAYKLTSPGSWAPRVMQVTAGALSTVLVYAIGARVFSRRAGLVAAVLFGLYGPVILEEALIIKTAWVLLVALAAFAALLRYAPAEDRRGTAAAGLLFGVGILSAGQWLPALPALAYAAWQLPERSTRLRRRNIALTFALAALLPVAAMSAWNTSHAGGFLLTSGDAGLNLYMGNNPEATGLPARPPGLRDIPEYEEGDARRIAERATGRAMTMPEVSRYWARRATEFMRGQTGDWVVVMIQKTQVLWNHFEVPDTSNYAFMRARYVPALRGMVTFGLVGALGLAGMLLLWSEDRKRRALYLATLPYLGALLLFYIRSRYRFPAVPFLAVFGAGLLDLGAGHVRAKSLRPIGIGAAVGLACLYLVNRTYCEPAHGSNPAFCLAEDRWFDDEYQQLVNRALIDHDDQAVRENLYAATQVREQRLQGMHQYRYAQYVRERAEELQAAGDPSAVDELREAARFASFSGRAEYRPGLSWSEAAAAFSALGDVDSARDALTRGSDGAPTDYGLALRAARQESLAGRCAEALRRIGLTRPEDPSVRIQFDAVRARCRQ
ncbi:MAG: glycosyltransferase family 39 protein [Polyangiales bacterium]